MKKFMTLAFLLSSAVLVIGCTSETTNTDSNATDTAAVGGQVGDANVTFVAFCGECGHGVASTEDHVCDSEHAACDCGFHKGSELCCKEVEGGKGKFFCATCGQEKGTDACCAADGEKCEGCGFHKGSALCCKLAKADDQDHGDEDTDAGTADKQDDDSSEESEG